MMVAAGASFAAPTPQGIEAITRTAVIHVRGIGVNIFWVMYLVPWAAFAVTFALTASVVRHAYFNVYALTMATIFALVYASCFFALEAVRNRTGNCAAGTRPTWCLFFAVTLFVSAVFGTLGGNFLYRHSVQPYYEVLRMGVYRDVDPATMPGQNLLDAGQVTFVSDTRVDLKRAAAFKKAFKSYCAAPIVRGDAAPTTDAYDFWAVGVNCCGMPAHAEFRSSAVRAADVDAHGGVRVTLAYEESFYRMAAEQSATMNGLHLKTPLFFYTATGAQEAIDVFLADVWAMGMSVCMLYGAFCLILLGVTYTLVELDF
eukprot:NODE_1211_length_1209_cov_324.094454.p1 GENE.NODE_1211_length_1209_cov_324.094454~~NODE_1211_length_1209_cov_324.094454.p1  ORF type:complete len:359 (-),score=108.69 NODE_1211_length_1209_cov_324.094454:133-1077(-)